MSEFTHYIGVTVPDSYKPDAYGEYDLNRLGVDNYYVHKSNLIPAERVEIKPPPVVLPTTAGSVVRYRVEPGAPFGFAMRTDLANPRWRLDDGSLVAEDWFSDVGVADLTVMYVAPEEGS